MTIAALVTLSVEKGAEMLTKKTVTRPRPGKTDTGRVQLRDDAPTEGSSFP